MENKNCAAARTPATAADLELFVDIEQHLYTAVVSDSLDDPVILRQLSQFVGSPESLRARGITDPAAIRDIQTAARAVLERRTFVP